MESFPLSANIVVFAAAALVTWAAGARLTRHVDAVATATGAQRTFLGAFLLGGITSLPEAATVTTAAAVGGSSFAVGNVLGSASANMAILAGADALVSGKPIVGQVDGQAMIRQAALVIVLLAVTATAVVAGEPVDTRIGLWTVVIVALAVMAFVIIRSGEDNGGDERGPSPEDEDADEVDQQGRRRHVTRLTGAAVVILAAGYTAARSGTVIAGQTGLSGGFVGFALLAVSTSLPELSTTVSSLRIGRPNLAFGNVLGTNVFNFLLLIPADLFDRRPLFDTVDRSVVVAAMLGVVLLGIYLVRLAGAPRAIGGRVGPESVLVLVVYAAGTVVLYAVS